MYGVAWTGGVVSPANPTYTVEELAFQLKDGEAKALVTQVLLLPVAREAAKKVGLPEDRIIVMGDLRDPATRVNHFTSIRNMSGTARFRKEKVDPKNDVAYLVYSSGTTGLPKGVMLSHRNIISNVLQTRAHELGRFTWNGGKDGQGDKVLAFLPFSHIYGKCLG
jgi:4-coumarate--CoA ligase